MRLLALTRYGRLGASSRMRFYQYLPWLKAADIYVEMAPLFSDDYVRGLQRQKRNFLDVAHAYIHRLRSLQRAENFDLLWIEKETLPWLPAEMEHALLSGRVPYVMDYDDAVFHYYDQHRNPLVRGLLGQKHQALIRRASLVVAGNDYLAEFARQAGAPQVEVIPTVIDLARYPQTMARDIRTDGEPVGGWIGQRSTADYLKPFATVFQTLAAEYAARFEAVGIDASALGLPMAGVPWTEETEVASIGRFDVGMMPLPDEPFERGKCGYKLIQYMASGLPVVASPVGVNRQIVEHGVNGFLAETPKQWETSLRTLLTNPTLRKRMGQAGRHKVEKQYCLQVTGPTLAGLLSAAASQ